MSKSRYIIGNNVSFVARKISFQLFRESFVLSLYSKVFFFFKLLQEKRDAAMGSVTDTRILITGAAGQYGRLVVEGLLSKGISPSSLLLLTRTPSKLAEYASLGVDIRKGSFDDPLPDLAVSFAGAETMLLISTSRAGQRLPQHQNAINAGVKAGVKHIVYTSFLSAHLEDPTALVGKEHKATGMHHSQTLDCSNMSSVGAHGDRLTGNYRSHAGCQWSILDSPSRRSVR